MLLRLVVLSMLSFSLIGCYSSASVSMNRFSGKIQFVKDFAPWGLPTVGPTGDADELYFTVGSNLMVLNPVTGELTKELSFDCTPVAPVVMNTNSYYVAGEDMFVKCIDREQKHSKYRVSCNKSPIASLAVDENSLLVVTTSGNVFSTSSNDTQCFWKFDLGGEIASRALFHSGGLYLASLDSNVYKIKMSTGTLMWKIPLGDSLRDEPVIASDLLFVNAQKQGVYAINPDTGGIVWQEKDGAKLLSSSESRSYVFTKSSTLSVMDNQSGKNICKLNTSVVDYVATNTLDSNIYVLDDSGKLMCAVPNK